MFVAYCILEYFCKCDFQRSAYISSLLKSSKKKVTTCVIIQCLYYFPLCLSRIREYRKGSSQSVHLSVYHRAFLHDGWMDFLHIGYHDQVPWTTNACKIEFVSIPNCSNCGYIFINFDYLCYLREECNDFVHIL